jgi:hypothetical protein
MEPVMRKPLRGLALGFVLFAALAGILAAGPARTAPQSTAAAAPQAAQKPAQETEVQPAPLSPRDQTSLYVFLACLWFAIAFLLYFLRLRIREADRVFKTGLYGKADGHEGTPKP